MKLHKPQALEVIRLANQALLDFGKAATQLACEMEEVNRRARTALVAVRVNSWRTDVVCRPRTVQEPPLELGDGN